MLTDWRTVFQRVCRPQNANLQSKSTVADSTEPASRRPAALRMLLTGAAYMMAQILVSGLSAAVVFSCLIRTGTSAELQKDANLREFFSEHIVLITLVAALPMAAVTFGLCWYCREFLDHRRWTTMGFYSPARHGLTSIFSGLCAGALLITTAAGLTLVCGGYTVRGSELSVVTLLLAPALFLMAFSEELIFRGYLLQNLMDDGRTKLGLCVTSVLFWLLHGLNPNAWSSPVTALNLFGAGFILGQAYLLSGNLWFPTAIHFSWNAVQGLLFSFPVSGLTFPGLIAVSPTVEAPVWLTGGQFGLEASVAVTVVEIALILIFLRGIRHRQGLPVN